MKRHLAATLLALSISAAAHAQQTPPQVQTTAPRIITTGQGEVRRTPDRAAVFVGVMTRAATAAAAAADNATRQTAIIDGVKALGIPAEQITTQNYSVQPEYQYDRDGRTAPRITGYIVSNTVRVDLRRIDQVASVIDASLAKGANQINGVEFSISTADAARREALAQAITRAREDAEAMARAAGGSLGSLIELSTTGPVYRPVFAAATRQMDMEMAPAAPPTPIEPGEQAISAFITAVWSFVQ